MLCSTHLLKQTKNSKSYKNQYKSEIFVVIIIIIIMRDLHEIVGILVQKPVAMRIRKRLTTTTLSGRFQEET